MVEVEDDGAGGAVIVPGGGLAGLAGRVEALDGTLERDQPERWPDRGPGDHPDPAAGRVRPPAGATGWVLPGSAR